VRGGNYTIEARSIGRRGTSSGWVAVSKTVTEEARRGARALPPVTVGNIGSLWTSGTTITWSATDTEATISVSAGTLQVGDQQIAYAASSAVITGVADEVRDVFLYYDDPWFSGGTRT